MDGELSSQKKFNLTIWITQNLIKLETETDKNGRASCYCYERHLSYGQSQNNWDKR